MAEGNPIAPVVDIEIGGTVRHLKLDFNGVAKAEEATGRNYLMVSHIRRGTAVDFTALLWGCLLHEDPSLTLEQVRSWVTFGNIARVIEAVMDAVTRSFPQADSEPAAEAGNVVPLERASRPRGKRSGAAPASTSD
jgi:hypothetical protein